MKIKLLFFGVSIVIGGSLGLPMFDVIGSANAQSIMPVPNRPISRPAPVRPRPTTRPAPAFRPQPIRPTRPRPSPSFTRPGITRPSPSFQRPPQVITRPSPNPINRPPAGWTRPSPGSPGLPAIPVYPKPIQPPVGWTRPTPGSPGHPALPVRPNPVRPPSPVIPDPNFEDMPTIIYPPIHRPPYVRPPHQFWGSWFWFDRIGWYHRYYYRNTLIVFVENLPAGCFKRVRRIGQIFYYCSDIYYRPITVRGERVYEVTVPNQPAQSSSSDNSRTLRLAKPYMRGSDVVVLQKALKRRGYFIGSVDGVFGLATTRGLKIFQIDVNLPASGVADRRTLEILIDN